MLLSSLIDSVGEDEGLQQDFAALLEKSFSSELQTGAVFPGEVLKVEKDGLLVDIGGKYEGYVPLKEIPTCHSPEDLQAEFKPGQVHEFYVLRDQEDEVRYILSVRRVNMVKNWELLNDYKNSQESIQATVLGTTKGGILAQVLGVKGFIPASQLRVTKAFEDLAGDELPVKVLEVDRNRNKLILSHRLAVFELKSAMRTETLGKLSEGDVVEGEVVKVTDFGVFVDINGIDGLLPLSEITWRRIKHPSDVLQLGQRVTVQVLTIDYDRQRISLSLKRLEEDPWRTVEGHFSVNDMVEGRVSKQLASGILAELIPGVEAYCAYGSNGKIFQLDTAYRFEVVSIAVSDRRITLEYRGPVA
ncbi:MAG: S1 RNA-binding domain-containing protein [Candidatus Melainabacteria bacterium]|nr:S1 RNA-binding domain-containing protein [Candidatus Melainabacteria bacterium]